MLRQDQHGIWSESEQTSLSYPEEGNSFCYDIEESSFWFNHRNEVILSLAKRFPFKDNFADIGGGNGFQIEFLKQRLPDKQFYLIEPGYSGCLNAKKRGVEHVYNTPFQKFPFHGLNIGAVGLFDVLEHIKDDFSFLTELKDHLNKGSRIFITTPAYPWLWSANDVHASHFRRYYMKDFNALARKCGLKLVYSSYFFSYLPMPTFLMRALPYRLRLRREWKAKRSSGEHRLTNAFAKRIVNRLNTFEIQRLQIGKFHFGASCFVIYET